MFTYVCLGSSDVARSARFYDPVMAALGQERCQTPGEEEFDKLMGWGSYSEQGVHEIALWLGKPFDGGPPSCGNGAMVAFKARSWAQVDAFHAAALAHGGTSEGAPGLRPQYNPDFYAAYVRDPDGNKLAAVCRGFTAPQVASD
jgi:catechol 2,3-dioxygenase-like lactoylglutathione lyase family enzyme